VRELSVFPTTTGAPPHEFHTYLNQQDEELDSPVITEEDRQRYLERADTLPDALWQGFPGKRIPVRNVQFVGVGGAIGVTGWALLYLVFAALIAVTTV